MTEVHQYGNFSPDDFAKLRSVIVGRASKQLTYDEVEDILGEILVEAVAASKTSGIPVVKLAFTAAKMRPRFYTKAVADAVRLEVERHPSVDPDWTIDDVAESKAALDFDLIRVARVLSFQERLVLLYVVAYNYTLAEVAKATGLPISTLHRRKRSALQAMKITLSNED